MDQIFLPADFKEFLKLLNAHGVKYLLIGGYAVTYYGYSRLTNDIDFWIATDKLNAERMVSVLQEFGFGRGADISLFYKSEMITRLGYPPLRIEILTKISGVEFEECHPVAYHTIINGIEVSIISLEDLKRNKKASGRYKDLDDLKHLS